MQNPFAITFALADGSVTARGLCSLASLSFPVPGTPAPLLLVGCTLKVDADAAQGILGGLATSASVFTPVALPGYQTGSYWTLRLHVDERFGRRGGRDGRVGDRDGE